MIIIIKKWKRKKYIQEENNLKNLLLVEISLKIVTSSRDHRINGTINHKKRSSDARFMHEPGTRMASRQLPVGLENGHA